MTNTNLSSRILYLPVSIESRVQLWVTYKDLKPVSTLQFIDAPSDLLKNNKVFKWLSDAGLSFAEDIKSKEFIFVSKKKNLASEASTIMWSEKESDILRKGELFGYPEKATKAFANADNVTVLNPINFPKYWGFYARYCVRTNHLEEDSLVAKKWADLVRKDIPKLARWYESAMRKAKYK